MGGYRMGRGLVQGGREVRDLQEGGDRGVDRLGILKFVSILDHSKGQQTLVELGC